MFTELFKILSTHSDIVFFKITRMKKIKCLSFEIPVDKISDYYRFFMVDVNIALRFDARQ